MIRLLSAIAMFWLGLGASAQTVHVSSPSNHISQPSSLTSRLGYDAFFLEAMVQRQKGNSDAAFDLLQHCVKLNPKASEAYYFLAQYYQLLRNDSLAQQCLLRAVELESNTSVYFTGIQVAEDRYFFTLCKRVRKGFDRTRKNYNRRTI